MFKEQIERYNAALEELHEWIRENGFQGGIRGSLAKENDTPSQPKRDFRRRKFWDFHLTRPKGVYRVFESGEVVDRSSRSLKALPLQDRH